MINYLCKKSNDNIQNSLVKISNLSFDIEKCELFRNSCLHEEVLLKPYTLIQVGLYIT